MVSLGRFGLSLFSIAPSFSYNSTSNNNNIQDATTTRGAIKQEESLDETIVKINEKIRALSTQIQEISSKIEGYSVLWNNAHRQKNRFQIENYEREMKTLFTQKNDLSKQYDAYTEQLRRLISVQTSTDRMKMTVSCVQATQVATAQLKTQMSKMKDLNPEENDMELYEMMEEMEMMQSMMDSTSISSSTSSNSDRDFAAFLAQQKTPPISTSTSTSPLPSISSIPSSTPTATTTQQLPSYLISKKPLFPEFDFTST